MSLDSHEYQQLYQRIEERFQKRTGCLKSWLIFFGLAFVSFFSLGALELVGDTLSVALGIFGLWGVYLILRSIWVYIDTVLWVRAKEKALHREIEMALWHKERRVPSSIRQAEVKRKNGKDHQHLRLSYDGELVSVDEFDAEPLDNYLYGHE